MSRKLKKMLDEVRNNSSVVSNTQEPITSKKGKRINVFQTFEFWNNPTRITVLKQWAMEGFTNEELAKKMGIARQTLYEWMKRSSDMADALHTSKDLADAVAEQALYKLATGTVERTYVDSKGQVRTIVDAPNILALKFFLMNRKPQKYKEQQKVEVTTNHETNNAVLEAIKKITLPDDDKGPNDGQ